MTSWVSSDNECGGAGTVGARALFVLGAGAGLMPLLALRRRRERRVVEVFEAAAEAERDFATGPVSEPSDEEDIFVLKNVGEGAGYVLERLEVNLYFG